MTDRIHSAIRDSNQVTRSIVVGVDNRGHSASAVIWAVDRAEQDGALLTLVSAHKPGAVPNSLAGAHDLATLARRLVLIGVAQREIAGDPVSVLLDETARADLLVVGARTMRPARRMVVGSTSRSLARWSPVPVVIVPEAWMQPSMATSPIVAAIRPQADPGPDTQTRRAQPQAQAGSDSDARVLEFAFARAAALRVPVIVVSSIEVPPLSAWSVFEVDRLRAEHDHALQARLSAWRQRHPSVEVVTRSTTQTPGEAVLSVAAIAQLVVIGRHPAHTLSGVSGRTIGHVLSHSTRPVAIVPTGSRLDLLREAASRSEARDVSWAPMF